MPGHQRIQQLLGFRFKNILTGRGLFVGILGHNRQEPVDHGLLPSQRDELVVGNPHLIHVAGHKTTCQVTRDVDGLAEIQVAKHVEIFPADRIFAFAKKIPPLPADSDQFDLAMVIQFREHLPADSGVKASAQTAV